jgi:hypothetical protein
MARMNVPEADEGKSEMANQLALTLALSRKREGHGIGRGSFLAALHHASVTMGAR